MQSYVTSKHGHRVRYLIKKIFFFYLVHGTVRADCIFCKTNPSFNNNTVKYSERKKKVMKLKRNIYISRSLRKMANWKTLRSDWMNGFTRLSYTTLTITEKLLTEAKFLEEMNAKKILNQKQLLKVVTDL